MNLHDPLHCEHHIQCMEEIVIWIVVMVLFLDLLHKSREHIRLDVGLTIFTTSWKFQHAKHRESYPLSSLVDVIRVQVPGIVLSQGDTQHILVDLHILGGEP